MRTDYKSESLRNSCFIPGVEPTRMGIGPVPAIDSVLKINGKTLNDIDLVEVNNILH